MPKNEPTEFPESPPVGLMPQTRWTLVGGAATEHPERAAAALGELYEIYRPPLLGLLRSKGSPPENCEDLLQGFFNHLISKSGLRKVQRAKGKFRTFLRAALMHYAIDQWRKDPKEPHDSLDKEDELTGEKVELPDSEPQPDLEFDRAWALTLLQSAMRRLEAEYGQRDRRPALEVLNVFLAERMPGLSHRDAAKQLGWTEGAVKTEVSRMRQRFRDFIDLEIADTLAHPTLQMIEEEKRALFAALGGG